MDVPETQDKRLERTSCSLRELIPFLVALRERRGLALGEVARLSGASFEWLYEMESGKEGCSLEFLEQYAEVLGVSLRVRILEVKK